MDFHLENFIRLYKESKFKELEEQTSLIIKKNYPEITENSYKYYLFHGLSLFKNQKKKQSINLFEKLINFKEDFEVNFHLGNSHLSLSEFKIARKYFEKCINENPKFIESYIQWLNTFRSDHFDLFQEKVNFLVKKFEKNSRLLFEIANIYYDMNEFLLAEKIYEQLLEDDRNQNNVLILLRLAACKEIKLDISKAIEINKKILSIEPELVDAQLNLSNLYRSINEKNESVILLNKVIEKNPYNFEARRQFSVIHKYKDSKEKELIFLKNLEKKTFFSEIDNKNKALYHFTLTKAYEDLKQYNLSAYHLVKGNELRRKEINYNQDLTFKQFDEIKKFTSIESIEKYKSSSSISKPVFIVGMPRSGTTLVEQIISSHSQVFGAGELFFFQRLIKRYFPESDPVKFVNNLVNDLPVYRDRIGQEYLKSIESLKVDKNINFITDKNPFNFIFISLIKIIFPKVKIIYCKRDFRDNGLSIFKNYFPMSGIGFAYHIDELRNYYAKHEDLMQHYIKVIGKDIYTIQYEDLINENKNQVEKLLDFLNLPWDNSCLEFYKNKNVVKTLSTTQVRSKISNQSINSWKNFEKFLPSLFSEF